MYNGQMNQDVFVDRVLENKINGVFLDIGAGTGGINKKNDPGFYSNTYFFEKYMAWKGIAIDYDKEWQKNVSKHRYCVACIDLLEENINDVLDNLRCPTEIDYLSFDVDDAQEKVFNDLDFDKYKFKVITYEHNLFQAYIDNKVHTEEQKGETLRLYIKSRERFNDLGYRLLWSNVMLKGYGPVEDWWVSNEVFETTKVEKRYYPDCKEILNV